MKRSKQGVRSRARVWVARSVLALMLIGFVFCVAQVARLIKAQEQWAGSTVKIERGEGHGSGVHIGRGLILTAAHVVDGVETVEVKTDRGKTTKGDVVWISKEYDIALIYTEADHLSASRLNCQPLEIGQSVKAVGNPGIFDFMPSWGHVSSAAETRAKWKSAIIADITIAPGSSGGPLFDDRHRVVGIVVGVALTTVYGAPLPLMSVVPYSYIVPATAVCRMMGMA